jgi:hypothetical protein
LPTFTPVMQTLLGGVDPASFPRAPGITPVSTGSGETALDIPNTDAALHEDGAQIAQAKPMDRMHQPTAEGIRGVAPPTEPPPNDPETEKAFQDWPGVDVVLGNGERIPDPRSPTGHIMAPFNDLNSVAAAGRSVGWKALGTLGRAWSVDEAKKTAKELTRQYLAQGGDFDYQRRRYEKGKDGFTQLPQFRNISNINVGLFLEQAFRIITGGTHIKFDKDYALKLAGEYARENSSNYRPNEPYGLDPETRKYIERGYDIGLEGNY